MVTLIEVIERKAFRTGRIFATPGAIAAAEEGRADLRALLARHRQGDWGDLSEEDWQRNDEALTNGARLFSSYGYGDDRIWIITEANRQVTTVLLPSEY